MKKLLFSLFVSGQMLIAGAHAQSTFEETPRYVPQSSTEMKMSFAPLVRDAAPAVVNIYTKGVVRTRSRSAFRDPFFDEFFGRRGFGGMTRERVQSSLGSGVIVEPDGVIVTNNHVIENMTEIKVVLNDRREFNAEVLLADPQTDLAILKIEVDEALPYLSFADSDTAEVGDIVLAIGNPFGVGQTVTNGIVSALARTNVSVSDFQFFIQTDAAINPGNSGGALIDVDGQLLGVNTAIFSRSGGSNGIGFAIPGNLVRQVVNSAVSGSSMIQRPWLGASTDTVTSDLAKALGLDRPKGALVNELFANGPADRGGLREGDVITRIDDDDIFDSDAMRYHIATKQAGQRVDVNVIREGQPRQLRVMLDFPPETPAANETVVEGRNPFTGTTIANMSPALNQELRRSFNERGVVVLKGNRYAREKHKILSVNGEKITSVDQLMDILATSQSRRWTVQTQSPRGQISTLRVGI
jgi:Do/DeqQ family serine protease